MDWDSFPIDTLDVVPARQQEAEPTVVSAEAKANSSSTSAASRLPDVAVVCQRWTAMTHDSLDNTETVDHGDSDGGRRKPHPSPFRKGQHPFTELSALKAYQHSLSMEMSEAEALACIGGSWHIFF
jgi:hypothetical protein